MKFSIPHAARALTRNALRALAAGCAGLALLLAALSLALAPARADIGAYLLFDMADGRIIAEHRASERWYPASLTKLMTAYVVFDAVEREELAMTSPVRISPQARQQPPSRMGFPTGTIFTVETGLRIILTKSANDVSVALAEAVGGTQAGFIDLMNETARKLGMTSSGFDNPHGLPNRKQVTSARDMALLMMALQNDFPQFSDFFTMSGVRLGKRNLRNHNKLIRQFQGADGMKTGFICSSGFNLAASATRDGLRLGAVVLGGITSRARDERTAELLAKGFEAVKAGAAVALDGFGEDNNRLAHAPVSGVQEDLGTVAALAAASDEAVDLRPIVCGNKRPVTRYTDGVVATLGELEAHRAEMLAYQTARQAREDKIAEVLSAPRAVAAPVDEDAEAARQPKVDAPRALASAEGEDELRPDDWMTAAPFAFPVPHPGRKEAIRRVSLGDFAPDDWAPSKLLPPQNPLIAAGLGAALPDKPVVRPLGYLGPAKSTAPIVISLGRADEERPNALSGTVIGGGPAPLPRSKPLLSPVAEAPAPETVSFQTVDDGVVELAEEVRSSVE